MIFQLIKIVGICFLGVLWIFKQIKGKRGNFILNFDVKFEINLLL